MSEPSSIKSNLETALSELSGLAERLDGEAAGRLADAVLAAPTVFMAGAGRSGLVARAAAMRLMHTGKRVFVVGEIVTPAVGRGDLLLIVSGSGETSGLINLAGKALERGAGLALVTANPDSSLGRLAGVSVRIATRRPGVPADEYVETIQPMGNLFEQGAFLFLDALNVEIMARLGTNEKEMFARHANLE